MKIVFSFLFQTVISTPVTQPSSSLAPINPFIVIQSTLTDSVINSSISPIDIDNITGNMVSGFKDVQSLTRKLLELIVLPSLNAENLLNLLVMVHDTFDVIIATARGLEYKLIGIIGSIDMSIINIQMGLQALIQTIVVNVVLTDETRNTTQNDINYSLLGIVDGIQLLLDTSYNLLNGIVTRPGNDLAKSMLCLEGIIQTILSITENLLHSLKSFLLHFKMDASNGHFMPMLNVALTNSLNKLARNISHPVTSIIKESLEPTLLSIIVKLRSNAGSVAESSLLSIQNISNPINDLLATIINSPKLAAMTLTSIPHVTRTLHSSMLSVIEEIKSLPGHSIGVEATFNVALSNTVGSLPSLISYMAVIASHGFTNINAVVDTPKMLEDTQIVLLLLATNVQTVIDTAIQAISQSLTKALHAKNVAAIDEESFTSLGESSAKISLLLENIAKIHLRALQMLLSGVSYALKKVLTKYSESLLLVATNLKSSLGDVNSVIEDMLTGGAVGNVSHSTSTTRLDDAMRAFKMVLDNVDNFRINVRNVFKAVESYRSIH